MDAPIQQPESPYEHSRRINNLARMGTVAQVRLAAPARVRVRCGGNLTGWIPWAAHRAGGAEGGRKWSPPIVGEQALVISPGGDLAQGVALLGVYSDALDQPSDLAGCERTEWDKDNCWQWFDGGFEMRLAKSCVITVRDPDIEGAQSRLTLLPDSAELVTPGCSISMKDGVVTITGGDTTLTIGPDKVRANADVIAEEISLMRHVHGGVEPGGDDTGEPHP